MDAMVAIMRPSDLHVLGARSYEKFQTQKLLRSRWKWFTLLSDFTHASMHSTNVSPVFIWRSSLLQILGSILFIPVAIII